MKTLIILSILLCSAAGSYYLTAWRRRNNLDHIENIVRKAVKADRKFFKLLKDPEYMQYYELCLNIKQIAEEEYAKEKN